MPTTATLSRPPMGWDGWRLYNNSATDSTVRAQANALVSAGLNKVGYTLINPSGSSQVGARVGGILQDNLTNFPNGVLATANYIRSLGLQWAVYSGPDNTGGCSGFNSHGFEANDVARFVALGAKYLMYDSCFDFGSVAATQAAYQAMGTALLNAPYPIAYLVSCPAFTDGAAFSSGSIGWFQQVGGSINCSAKDLGAMTFATMLTQIDNIVTNNLFGLGPNAYCWPDYLGIWNGNFNTATLAQTNMTMWCMLASPLWISADLTTISASVLAVLLNTAAIAIDQDPLTIAPVRLSHVMGSTEFQDIWYRQLNGKWAIALFNRDTVAHSFTINWSSFGQAGTNFSIYDVWAGQSLGTSSTGFTNSSIPSQSIQLLLLTPPSSYTMNQPSPTYDPRNPIYLQAFAAIPNTPPDLSVLINCTNNGLWTTGQGHIGNSGFVQVALTPPGSNSSWAVVYYDQANQSFGVTNSASGTNPVIQLPDYLTQVPVCAVLLNASTTAVTASMILDLTGSPALPTVTAFPSGSFSANTSFDTKGAASFNMTCTVTTTLNLNFINVRSGAFFYIVYFNSAGTSSNIGINMQAPSGLAWGFAGQLTTSATNAANPTVTAASTTISTMGVVTGTNYRIFQN